MQWDEVRKFSFQCSLRCCYPGVAINLKSSRNQYVQCEDPPLISQLRSNSGISVSVLVRPSRNKVMKAQSFIAYGNVDRKPLYIFEKPEMWDTKSSIHVYILLFEILPSVNVYSISSLHGLNPVNLRLQLVRFRARSMSKKIDAADYYRHYLKYVSPEIFYLRPWFSTFFCRNRNFRFDLHYQNITYRVQNITSEWVKHFLF